MYSYKYGILFLIRLKKERYIYKIVKTEIQTGNGDEDSFLRRRIKTRF